MTDNGTKGVAAENHPPQFGVLAIELGYITPEQLEEALREQKGDDLARRPRLPLGSILYEKGWIDLHQFEDIFNKRMEAVRSMKRSTL